MIKTFKEFLNESKKIEEKGEYQEFFMKTLEDFGVSSPSELSDEKKKEFFEYIEKNWTKEKQG
jgi:hypothetical protein